MNTNVKDMDPGAGSCIENEPTSLPDYTVKNNLRQLKAMRDLMYSCNNEDYITEWWLWSYPDEASDEELQEIAEDEDSFKDIASTFLRIMADIYEKNDLHNLTFVSGKIDEERPQEECE